MEAMGQNLRSQCGFSPTYWVGPFFLLAMYFSTAASAEPAPKQTIIDNSSFKSIFEDTEKKKVDEKKDTKVIIQTPVDVCKINPNLPQCDILNSTK